MVRFEQWDAILADQGPDHKTLFTRGVWHYARAMAFTAVDRLDDASRELVALRELVANPDMKKEALFSNNSGFTILRIAPEVVAGEIAAKRRDWDAAIGALDRAIRFEDALLYQEPHDWHAPARQNLAAVLLAAGRADEAETVSWEDLKRHPENVWSLQGIVRALDAQGKTDEARLVEARLRKVLRTEEVVQ
jgi:tetratricopeptide (TPR) repeat protein